VASVITLETGDDEREANMWAFARAALELLATAIAVEVAPALPGEVPNAGWSNIFDEADASVLEALTGDGLSLEVEPLDPSDADPD
jgi:hypothetical protein